MERESNSEPALCNVTNPNITLDKMGRGVWSMDYIVIFRTQYLFVLDNR